MSCMEEEEEGEGWRPSRERREVLRGFVYMRASGLVRDKGETGRLRTDLFEVEVGDEPAEEGEGCGDGAGEEVGVVAQELAGAEERGEAFGRVGERASDQRSTKNKNIRIALTSPLNATPRNNWAQ